MIDSDEGTIDADVSSEADSVVKVGSKWAFLNANEQYVEKSLIARSSSKTMIPHRIPRARNSKFVE